MVKKKIPWWKRIRPVVTSQDVDKDNKHSGSKVKKPIFFGFKIKF